MMGPVETYSATDLGAVEASTLKQYSVKVSLRRVPIDHRETGYGRAILAGLQSIYIGHGATIEASTAYCLQVPYYAYRAAGIDLTPDDRPEGLVRPADLLPLVGAR